MSKTRIKSDAAAYVPKTREEVDAAIARIGEAQRAREAIRTAMNDELAAVKARYEDEAAPHAGVIATFRQGVQTWCEMHRDELTRDGRTKTVRFGAGEVSWRMRPPKVTVRGEGIVLATLRKLGLERFVRVKEEIDKNAILADPAAVELVEGVAGLSISQGEDFVVKPFASEIEEVA